MKVNPYGIDSSRSISQVRANVPSNWAESIKFRENFNYADIEPDAYTRLNVDDTTLLLANILTGLIKKSLQLGLDIRRGKKKRMGDYVLEARFEPKSKQNHKEACIYIPIEDVDDLIAREASYSNMSLDQSLATYVKIVLRQTDNKSLIRLLIVTAHEFGHFMSYCHGNHDLNLAEGITLMHRDMVIGYDRYTSLVFFEESTAWRYGKEQLERLGFVWWDIFDTVKYGSLHAYYSKLKLAKSSLAIYGRLSMLDDFRKSASSDYFDAKPVEKPKFPTHGL